MQGRIELEEKIKNTIENEMLPTLPNFIVEWYYSLKGTGLTMKSCKDYLYKASLFFKSTNLPIDCDIADITPVMITKYFSDIQYKTNSSGEKVRTSNSYRNTVWYALNSLFNYHVNVKHITNNYMSIVKPKKGASQDIIKRYELSADDFALMLSDENIPGKTEALKVRNKAILTLLMTTGMRREALCQINIHDISEVDDKYVLTVLDKGEKEHTYKLSVSVLEALIDWLYIRKSYAKNTDALFITSRGTRITSDAIYNLVENNTKLALGYSLSPHKIRAGYCTILYEQTKDIEFVCNSVGHSQLDTTKRYIHSKIDDKEKASNIMESCIFHRK